MKRFFAKIGRFFWSWGFLKFILGTIAFIILFYVEEDWRGARAWAATKAEWEVKGESFDYNKFIPPPVPDDQNLAAIPLFKLEPVKETTEKLQVALNRAMRDDLTQLDFPKTGNWMSGELADMAQVKKTLVDDYALASKNTTLPNDSLAQFYAIYPFFTDFLAAAATHPLFRINQDYMASAPVNRPFGPIVSPIKLSKILTLHAILALDKQQNDLALPDIKTNYKILFGVKRDPSLVGGLVAIGMNAINGAAIYNGLAQHQWSDAQLVEIDETLRPINFLDDFQFAMRSEVAQSMANLDWFKKIETRKVLGGLFASSDVDLNFLSFVSVALPWADGWWDENKSQETEFVFQSLSGVDPKMHLVFPKEGDDLQDRIERAKSSWDAYAPWNIFVDMAAGPVTKSLQKYAQAQAWVDEMRIACALERYRLAKGVYPVTLNLLAPAYIDEVPHDIMNGQPYHYSLRVDGTFLLYSVGWNQEDDGGHVVYKSGNYTVKQVDYDEGDWVWPTPQLNPQK